MSTITIGPDMAAGLANCKVGEEEQILVTIVPTSIDETGIVADVTAAEYAEGIEEEPEAEVEAEIPPPAPKAKRPAAVLAIMGRK